MWAHCEDNVRSGSSSGVPSRLLHIYLSVGIKALSMSVISPCITVVSRRYGRMSCILFEATLSIHIFLGHPHFRLHVTPNVTQPSQVGNTMPCYILLRL